MARVEAASNALRALHVAALDRYRELLGREFDDIIRVSGQVHICESEEPSPNETIYCRLWEKHGVVAELTRHYLIERDEPVDAIADLCVAFCLEGLQPHN